MEAYEKVRLLRDLNRLTQEQMAEKLVMTPGGYAKIERRETRLSVDMLSKIAEVFQIDARALLRDDEKTLNLNISQENSRDISFYSSPADLTALIEKLKNQVIHEQALSAQKDREITALRELVELLKSRNG